MDYRLSLEILAREKSQTAVAFAGSLGFVFQFPELNPLRAISINSLRANRRA